MPINASDISLVLSGGPNNSNPYLSLGDNPSATRVVSSNLNNLFDDVSADQAVTGEDDYRCVYLFNDGTDSVYSIEVWILSEVAGGASIQVGILPLDESQRITLNSNTINSGSFTIGYSGSTYVSNYNSDLSVWASSLQTGLRSLGSGQLLENVVVKAQTAGQNIIFDISFVGFNGKRNHDLLEITNNTLSPAVSINVTTIQNGSPINTIAPSIDIETTPPSNINFYSPTQTTPITLPYLAESEGFPLWIKRTTEAGASAVESDGFSLRIKMKSLKPLN